MKGEYLFEWWEGEWNVLLIVKLMHKNTGQFHHLICRRVHGMKMIEFEISFS
jgi:hypothetical protein